MLWDSMNNRDSMDEMDIKNRTGFRPAYGGQASDSACAPPDKSAGKFWFGRPAFVAEVRWRKISMVPYT